MRIENKTRSAHEERFFQEKFVANVYEFMKGSTIKPNDYSPPVRVK